MSECFLHCDIALHTCANYILCSKCNWDTFLCLIYRLLRYDYYDYNDEDGNTNKAKYADGHKVRPLFPSAPAKQKRPIVCEEP